MGVFRQSLFLVAFLAACGNQTSKSSSSKLGSAKKSNSISQEAASDDLTDDSLGAPMRSATQNTSLSNTNPRFLYAINPSYRYQFFDGIYFLDLFDSSVERISLVKSRGNVVVCYFSAGSWENWRSDKGRFPSSALGQNLEGWAGERWLDYRNSTVQLLMKERIRLAKQKGCDGVDPDNIDGHTNSTGFSLSSNDQYNYLRVLSQEARNQGLKIGLKNSAETASRLEPLFDWVVAEECLRYNECGAYKNSFGKKGKPMMMIEYEGSINSLCSKARSNGASLNYADYDLTTFKLCR